jgi:UDP-N-acetylmuramate dehydrogenase
MHANYFVNTGGGTASDVRRLMDVARATVKDRFGVSLIPEVKVIAPNGSILVTRDT